MLQYFCLILYLINIVISFTGATILIIRAKRDFAPTKLILASWFILTGIHSTIVYSLWIRYTIWNLITPETILILLELLSILLSYLILCFVLFMLKPKYYKTILSIFAIFYIILMIVYCEYPPYREEIAGEGIWFLSRQSLLLKPIEDFVPLGAAIFFMAFSIKTTGGQNKGIFLSSGLFLIAIFYYRPYEWIFQSYEWITHNLTLTYTSMICITAGIIFIYLGFMMKQ